jgi:hypothetical protein
MDRLPDDSWSPDDEELKNYVTEARSKVIKVVVKKIEVED